MDSSALTLKIQMASAVVALLLVIVTVVYTCAARRMGAEMRKQTEAAVVAAEASRTSAQASQQAAAEMKLSRAAEFVPFIVEDTAVSHPTSEEDIFVFKNIGRYLAKEIFVYAGFGSMDSKNYYFCYTSPVTAKLFLAPGAKIGIPQRSLDHVRSRYTDTWEEGYHFFVEFVYKDIFDTTYRSVAECRTRLDAEQPPRAITYVWKILSPEEVAERKEWHGLVQREQL